MITCNKVMQVLEKCKNLLDPKVRNVQWKFEQEHFPKCAHNLKNNSQYKPLADPS